jgi:hypothetical protein
LVFGFVDHVKKRLDRPNSITKYFVLQARLVLGGFDVKYNVSNVTMAAIADIKRNWPAIKNAIERTFRFLNGLGSRRTTSPRWTRCCPSRGIRSMNRPGGNGECFVQMSGNFIKGAQVRMEGLICFLRRDVSDGRAKCDHSRLDGAVETCHRHAGHHR